MYTLANCAQTTKVHVKSKLTYQVTTEE